MREKTDTEKDTIHDRQGKAVWQDEGRVVRGRLRRAEQAHVGIQERRSRMGAGAGNEGEGGRGDEGGDRRMGVGGPTAENK